MVCKPGQTLGHHPRSLRSTCGRCHQQIPHWIQKLSYKSVYESCKKRHADVVISDVGQIGGAGGRDLAEKVIQLAQEENHFSYVYDEEDSIETKLTKIVTKKVYGGKALA